ncbi:nSTAND1 domain-containing NTPase [Candidatus Thiothrix anitrata]|uniref:SUMF1/EgtB/PvdO family nonheme iron enzyme n=1 Tax=Candidatus Thiothrix anitrata TaxID=2823902 RepID=A0ABX7X215_9GAMM|nr:SUMF1/EgtB/PvdO family nonheme iron enzyme [Candidatus Thiothrix anitrata]QTR49974.1 SUMF1/EgtB/PvdO family nonheme iron enzyme [Candidatus Thiothrix anitrata]
MTSPQIFLSYSRTNKDAAKTLRERLEQAGFSVFRDEESIRIGDNWLKSLQDAVQGCAAFVLLVGRDGVQQQRWVGAEVEVALSRKLSPHDDRERLPIFPVLLAEAVFADLPVFLQQIQSLVWHPGSSDLPHGLREALQTSESLQTASQLLKGEPYRGLSYFRREDADRFFGRHEEVLQALHGLGYAEDIAPESSTQPHSRYYRWLQIHAASGAGKSSLVRAGMLPKIEQGLLWRRTGYADWKILEPMMPAEKPVAMLAEKLAKAFPQKDMDEWEERLGNPAKPAALSYALRPLVPAGSAVLLVVDQFEELFTLAEESERRQFDRLLATALADLDCPLFLISTIRSDFLDRFEYLPELLKLYNTLKGDYLLPTMTEAGLRELIVYPARLAGLQVDEGLVEAMLNDAKGEPGALPLVENALRVLWEQREGNRLSGELYLSKGGIAGLLEEQADALLARLDRDLPKGKADALELLLSLTRINDEGRHTRRRLPLGEARLAAGGKKADPVRGQKIIDYLSGRLEPDGSNRKANGSLRLLTVVGEERNPSPTDSVLSVDLIHETLIRAKGKDEASGKLVGYWKTLYDYIDKNRERGFYRDQLARQAKEWQGKSVWGRWFNLAGWGELRAYRKLRPERGSVDERFLHRSRRMAWVQGGALALLLGFVGQSYLWTLNNAMPPGYMLTQQQFRLASWGLLPEPLPEMVEIPLPEGEFQVGDNDASLAPLLEQNGIPKEQVNMGIPPVMATLTEAFALGKYEVTFEQYDYYVWSQQGVENSPAYPGNPPNENARGQRAVVNVSWDDAQGYLQWLSIKTGDAYRLPTEAEWEYAARAGTTTGYWWGDEVGQNNANCLGCGSQWDNKFVAPVGSFKPNPFGLYDTAGNVWEWTCSEWQIDFDGSEGECAKPDAASNRRVSRGGSWFDRSVFSRPSARYWSLAGSRTNDVGLRVLRASRTP